MLTIGARQECQQADGGNSMRSGGTMPLPTVGVPHAGRRRWISSEAAVGAIFAVTFIVTAFLIVTPLASLLYGSFRTGGPGTHAAYTLKNWLDLTSSGVIGTLITTCVIAVLTAVISTACGGLMAWLIYRTDFRYKRLLVAAIGLSFFFPGFILAMAWVILASPGGIFNDILSDALGIEAFFDIYSSPGIVWIQVLHITPFAFFTLRSPLLSMDSSLEEAAYASGANPWSVVRRVTLPLMLFPLLSSLLLCFVLSVEQFAIPAMVGIPGHVNVLATELYLLTSFSPPNTGLAAAVGLAMSAVTGLSIFAQRRIVHRRGAPTVTGRGYRIRPLRLGRMRPVAHCACFAYVLLSFVIPAIALVYTSLIKFFVANPFDAAYTLRNYQQILDSPGTVRSFWNTLIVSGGGALLGLLLGTLIAYSTHRLKPHGYRALDILASLPFGIPGIVIGLGFLWSYVYLPIYGTLWVLVFCYVARFLPYATETIGAQVVQLDRALEEAAWASGAHRIASFRRIVLPLLRPALQSAYFLLFIAYFREIAAAALIYTASTQVLSISIWAFFENANWGVASALSVIATLITVALMAAVMRAPLRL
jgi:iron(III) transport system permease protein